MKVVKHTAEAFKYAIVVPSLLDTGRMAGRALAATSTYGVMVCSEWGSTTGKMEEQEIEAHYTRWMELSSSMTID